MKNTAIYALILILTQFCSIEISLAEITIANRDLKYYIAQNDHLNYVLFKENKTNSHRLIEIDYENELSLENIVKCYLYGDQQLAENAISQRPIKPKVTFIGEKEMNSWINACSEFLINSMKRKTIQYYDDNFPEEFNNQVDINFLNGLLIYPGTKWCGAGDIAAHYDDLGREVQTDICCREHDHCFDYIEKSQSKHNLTNKAIHTKSHCYCDKEFKTCLQESGSGTSNSVARLYFNLVQVQCFKKDHPIVKCLEYKGMPFYWKSCQKYELNINGELIFQFFDAKFYSSK